MAEVHPDVGAVQVQHVRSPDAPGVVAEQSVVDVQHVGGATGRSEPDQVAGPPDRPSSAAAAPRTAGNGQSCQSRPSARACSHRGRPDAGDIVHVDHPHHRITLPRARVRIRSECPQFGQHRDRGDPGGGDAGQHRRPAGASASDQSQGAAPRRPPARAWPPASRRAHRSGARDSAIGMALCTIDPIRYPHATSSIEVPADQPQQQAEQESGDRGGRRDHVRPPGVAGQRVHRRARWRWTPRSPRP